MKSAEELSRCLAGQLSRDERKTDVVRFGAEIVSSTVPGTAAVVTAVLFAAPFLSAVIAPSLV